MVTLLLAALLLGTTFAHTLEIMAKLQYDGPLSTRLQQTLYPFFAWVGGPVEIGAIVAAALLAFMLRHDQVPFLLGSVAAVCFALAFLGIWILSPTQPTRRSFNGRLNPFRPIGLPGADSGIIRMQLALSCSSLVSWRLQALSCSANQFAETNQLDDSSFSKGTALAPQAFAMK